jgi:PBP1b-binding outer membrane lipoprotein LpoB
MKIISLLAALFIAIIVLTACAPSAAPEAAQQPIVEQPAGGTLVTDVVQETASPVSIESAADTPPLAVATSRGDQLVATDPTTVNLSGGAPTLVEFFRFT